MYKELASDIEGFKHPGHGTLNGWARQGTYIIMLFYTLTRTIFFPACADIARKTLAQLAHSWYLAVVEQSEEVTGSVGSFLVSGSC